MVRRRIRRNRRQTRFSRRRYFKRRPRGILSNVVTRKVELTLPVYLKANAAGTGATGGGVYANYTFTGTTDFQTCFDFGVDYTGTTSTGVLYAPEVVSLSKAYSHYRVTGVSMRYCRSNMEYQVVAIGDPGYSNTCVTNSGPLSFHPTFSVTANGQEASSQNYSFDNALRVAAGQRCTKSKYWRYPNKPIMDDSTRIANAWVPCSTNLSMYANIGQPSQGSTVTHSAVSQAGAVLLMGTLVIKVYLQFGIPQTKS